MQKKFHKHDLGVFTRSEPTIKPSTKPLKVVTAINNILFKSYVIINFRYDLIKKMKQKGLDKPTIDSDLTNTMT